jgi:proteasome lid subunit RPN8/RPN11|tara:strand:- start:13326 stop:13982 length:657 start_codon:yes stop_codon:yes gene_type:complete
MFSFYKQTIKDMTDHCIEENPNEACGVILGKTLLDQFKSIYTNQFSIDASSILFDSNLTDDLNLTQHDIKKIIEGFTKTVLEIDSQQIINLKTVYDSLKLVAENGGGDIASSIVRITNTAQSPYRYQMDPQEFLDADKKAGQLNLSILGFYHSHTHTSAYPSDTDIRLAIESGWTDPYYILISLENILEPEVKMYQINIDGTVIEEEYSSIDMPKEIC